MPTNLGCVEIGSYDNPCRFKVRLLPPALTAPHASGQKLVNWQ
jgi:hypothetical protein